MATGHFVHFSVFFALVLVAFTICLVTLQATGAAADAGAVVIAVMDEIRQKANKYAKKNGGKLDLKAVFKEYDLDVEPIPWQVVAVE